jgi:hypothetical protein
LAFVETNRGSNRKEKLGNFPWDLQFQSQIDLEIRLGRYRARCRGGDVPPRGGHAVQRNAVQCSAVQCFLGCSVHPHSARARVCVWSSCMTHHVSLCVCVCVCVVLMCDMSCVCSCMRVCVCVYLQMCTCFGWSRYLREALASPPQLLSHAGLGIPYLTKTRLDFSGNTVEFAPLFVSFECDGSNEEVFELCC